MRPRGFTVVELLATIAVVGVLGALLLPALASTRESARRAQCANNLRQFGVALAAYEDAHQRLVPSGSNLPGEIGSPHARLLPYFDVGELATTSAAYCESRQSWPGLEFARDLASVPTFRCPSATGGPEIGGTNYFGCYGPGAFFTGARGHLPEGYFSPFDRRLATLPRGRSHVVAFSERIFGDGETAWLDRRRDILNIPPAADGALQAEAGAGMPPERQWLFLCGRAHEMTPTWGRHLSFAGFVWNLPGFGATAYMHCLPPNSAIGDCQSGDSPLWPVKAVSARSEHAGGVNALFADGHVDFAGDAIDFPLWRGWAFANDGENFP